MKLGSVVTAYVQRSSVTGELYIPVALPNDGKFKQGDKVRIGVIHWRDRPRGALATPDAPPMGEKTGQEGAAEERE